MEIKDNYSKEPQEFKPTILTVEQMASGIPAISVSSIRGFLLKRKENGLLESGAIIYIGSRISLDKDKFINWLVSSAKN